ncbi:lipid II flippase MurJ [Rhodococcus sp. IEGM 1379]|uniref:murein biosynthesis integral membrane protein MurJ n=1 Tax=Rhodococcus sp. IEGM 1379 TaxID=3047086 RepID=UPI0024B84D0B|nr:lipid II flippase MurJ [Rhodococcus sp. IEGM 1379]MDI9919255.1 lipid II flippase MurJ [Rhodococcus sp. IEGM 1379]
MAVSQNTFARATGAVAVATAASRATGFVRTLALAAVLGTAAVGDAYNGANSMPNMVYELLLGGVMSSVLIPVLARARLRGRTYSRVFTQRLLLAAVLGAAVVTAIAVACAPLLVAVLVSDAEQSQLATVLAYLLLPEIFFYAIAATVTAVLNVRESYAPAAWASVGNNLIVLATVGVFAAVPGPVTLLPSTMTTAQVLVLGFGTTIGIVGQAVWTVAALRRTGFRWSWRVRPVPYTWRPIRAGTRLLGWVLLYVAISQVGVAVVLRVAFSYGGVSTYTYADLLFQVPYGILGVSLLTVLMPRISRAVALGDRDALVADMGRAARYSVLALVPAAVAMTLLGPMLTTVMFVGRVDVDAARTIGVALALSAFGLPPFALVMLQLRVFYAGNDMRTPALINAAMVATKIAVIALGVACLPDQAVVVMLPVASSLSYVVGAVSGHLVLRHRYGLLGFHTVRETFSRVLWASIAAGVVCVIAVGVMHQLIDNPRAAAAATLAAVLVLGAPTFLITAQKIGIPEVRNAKALLNR